MMTEASALNGLKGRVETLERDIVRTQAEIDETVQALKARRRTLAYEKDMVSQYRDIIKLVEDNALKRDITKLGMASVELSKRRSANVKAYVEGLDKAADK